MNKIILIAALSIGLLGCSDIDYGSPKALIEGYRFCLDMQSWEQLNDAIIKKDTRMISYLEQSNLCGTLRSGIEYSIINRSFGGTANVRVWVGDKHFDIYTNNEATR